ncbi:carbohydrate ABC transporter permease [Beduinella massiliensis]|uniref:carbohydrate ABC transporter permease n=1 Tax=Beduinella massiliensis TaxID=1852363 RepID=UPI0031F853F0
MKAKALGRAALYAAYALIVLFMLFPIFWTLLTSFKSEAEIFRFPPTIWPEHFTVDSYRYVLDSNIPRQMLNSVAVCAQTIVVTLLLSTMGGFAFARATFRGKNVLLFFLVGTQMIPGLSNIITLYMMGSRMGLLNSHAYLVLIYSASSAPVCVWLMKGYFEQIPASLDEAALVDGCTRLGTLFRIVLPLVRTGIAACAMMVFVNAWNEFLVSLTMIGRTKLKTFPVGLQAFMADNDMDWMNLSAATILGLLPVLALFISFQKSFVEGMTSGAIKA